MTAPAALAVAVALAVAAAGCGLGGSPPSYRYVVLAPSAGRAAAPREVGAARRAPVLVVARVTLPDYLQRDDVARRVGPQELVYSSTERWAEPLEDAVARNLRLDLAARLEPAIVVQARPAGGADRYVLLVDVVRFEEGPGGQAELWARWTVRHGGAIVHATETRTRVAMAEPGASAMAAALSTALDRLGTDIATAVVALVGRRGPSPVAATPGP